jgi:hypothetical protein
LKILQGNQSLIFQTMNTPNIQRPEKPKIGVLFYGNKQVGKPDLFRNLTAEQTRLISIGYDKSLFHKHYFYGKSN